jgi:polyisoprenoid-binding protein YceI
MKNTLLMLIGLLAVSSFITLPLAKKKITADTNSSQFMYGLHHPLHSFESTARDFKCIGVFNDENQQLEVMAASVAVKNFNSGNSNRDSHVIEIMEALKFPTITFSSQDISYAGNRVTAKGSLVFHGQSKEFSISGTQNISGNKLSINGKFDVNMTDFSVKPPSLMGMSTDENINVTFDFKFDI